MTKSELLQSKFEKWAKTPRDRPPTDGAIRISHVSIINNFMREHWGKDWEESDSAIDFYENVGHNLMEKSMLWCRENRNFKGTTS